MECQSLKENAQHVVSITDPAEVQAACDGLLTVAGRKLLVTRGGDANNTAGRVFIMFANKTDRTGAKFKFSRTRRGLVEVDPMFKNVVRVTPANMENYIKEWFTFGE